jgi:hypothetical protein
VRDTQTGDSPTRDAAIEQEEETGGAAAGTREGAGRWVVPALVVVAVVLAIVNILVFDGSAGGWIVLAGIVVVTIGVAIALNPRRSSIPGGTAER